MEMLKQLHNDESGATATEYLILLVLIAVAVIAIVGLFGNTVKSKFNDAQQSVNGMDVEMYNN